MKKLLIVSLIATAASWFLGQMAFSTDHTGANKELAISQQNLNLEHILPGVIVPPTLPRTIPDDILMESWIHLYNQRVPVHLWDGSTLTGRDLAQFVLDHSIPIVWDMENKCHGVGCSIRYCDDQICLYEDEEPDIDPIYIDPVIKDSQLELMGTLAHEIYHRQEPFGAVRDTLYEEYWAYSVEVQITGASRPQFEGYDPRNPVCLKRWFNRYGLFSYLDLPAYPESVSAAFGFPIPTECTMEGDLVCIITLEGQANCQTFQMGERLSQQRNRYK